MALGAIDFGEDILVRAQELASRAGNPAAGVWSVENDILRSAWTFVGASIDTYFHERVRRALIARPMSKSARKFTLPLGDVEDMVDGFLANRAKSRPRVRLNNVIHEALLKETFQGSRNVERAFGLAGVAKPWAPLATSLGDSQDGVRGRLDRQYNRRNRIAHEGDYARQERPQHFYYDVISRQEVDAEIAWTRAFLAGADAL